MVWGHSDELRHQEKNEQGEYETQGPGTGDHKPERQTEDEIRDPATGTALALRS